MIDEWKPHIGGDGDCDMDDTDGKFRIGSKVVCAVKNDKSKEMEDKIKDIFFREYK